MDVSLQQSPPGTDGISETQIKRVASRLQYLSVRSEFGVAVYALSLVFVSIVLFMLSTTAQRVEQLITDQNAGALKLWSDLEYYRDHRRTDPLDVSLPPGLFDELVQFSRNNGELIFTIHRLRIEHLFGGDTAWQTARQYFSDVGGIYHGIDPTKEGKVEFDHYGVDPHTDSNSVIEQGNYQIELYQLIRDYAQYKSNYLKWILGAVTTYALPVAYALLGSLLFVLYPVSRPAMDDNTAVRPDPSRRLLIAIIAGIAVSMFSSFFPAGVAFPPLALAFLAGYSIEMFSSGLNRIVDGMLKDRPS